MAIIQWNKKYTETLSETLKRFRFEKPEFKHEKVTYAGRLDPMAEGLVILLTGEDVYKKDKFLGLDKIYEVDFVFGPETDTYDLLGILGDSSTCFITINEEVLRKVLFRNIGVHEQKYPPYSSKPVKGKPLFIWARENKLDKIVIPAKKIEIYNIEYLGSKKVLREDFKKNLVGDIKQVKGDFRQDEIIEKWGKYFSENDSDVVIYSIRVSASSGAYMRTLIQEIGTMVNSFSCSLKIKRTRVGEYDL